jgi:hypothetical protein
MKNQKSLLARVYKSSLTYQNLLSKMSAVVNITSDIDFFLKLAFKDANPEREIPSNWFEKAEIVEAPRLRKSEAWIEVSVTKMTPINTEKAEVECKTQLLKAKKVLPRAYCRAYSATIEALIHATRIHAFLKGNEKQREQANQLIETFGSCREIVERVAPDSTYAEIMAYIARQIESWRGENESLH